MDSSVAETPNGSDYFITADAGFCHILPGNIIITSLPTYQELPPARDRKNWTALTAGSLGVAFGSFLMFNFFKAGLTLMGTMFFLAMLFATKALVEVARYTTVMNIERDKLLSIEVCKPRLGYIYLRISYTNKAGNIAWRKIKLYDSAQNETHALELLKNNGLIRS
ncbi:MAG: hypothetical protein ACHQRM_04900 [Bacteroidia bacterium]